MTRTIDKRWVLCLPLVTLLASYFYLAVYHQTWWLFDTIIHESGQLSLGATILYAAHFLGHIPSLTVAALILFGSLRLFGCAGGLKARTGYVLIALLLFLVGCFGLAEWLSGGTITWQYVLQQRQGESRLESGGSWLLHLPTTMLLFTAIPVYAAVLLKLLGQRLDLTRRGRTYFGFAAGLTIVMTLLACPQPLRAVLSVWTDARYLAHSIRELATYPLLIFPVAIFLLVGAGQSREKSHPKAIYLLWGLSALTAGALFWKVYVALGAGIGSIAQKPAFAQGGELSVTYLLASHYFEHILDTIYFVLFCLLLNSAGAARPASTAN